MFGYVYIVKPDRVSSADFISGKLPPFALQKRAALARGHCTAALSRYSK
jgi:hypothetical protein